MKNRLWCFWCAVAAGTLAAAILAMGGRAIAQQPAPPAETKPADPKPAEPKPADPKPADPPAVAEKPQRDAQIILGLSETELKIEKALYASTKMDLHETPLKDVVDFLKDLHGIPVSLDRGALVEAGLSEDMPITLSTKDVSLRSALSLMLAGSQLDWIVQDETLLITTKEKAVRTYCSRAYDLAPLMMDTEDMTELSEIVHVIDESLQRNVSGAPEVVGDAVTATTLPRKLIQHRYLLIVRDNRAAQDEVQRMLIIMLEAKAAMPEPKPKPMFDPSMIPGGLPNIPGLPMLPGTPMPMPMGPRVLPVPTDR